MKSLSITSWNIYMAPTMFNRFSRMKLIENNIRTNLKENDILCLQEVHSWRIGLISKLLFSIAYFRNFPTLMQILDAFSIIEGLLFPLFVYCETKEEIIKILRQIGYNYFHYDEVFNYYMDTGLITASKYPMTLKYTKSLKSNLFIPSSVLLSEIDGLFVVNCHFITDEENLDSKKKMYFKLINKLCCINLGKNFITNNRLLFDMLSHRRNILVCGDVNLNYDSIRYSIFKNYLKLNNIPLTAETTQCPKTYEKNQIDYFLYNSLDPAYKPTYAHILKMNYNDEELRLEDITGSDHFAIETKL